MADFGVSPGAEAASGGGADVEDAGAFGFGAAEGLGIGVNGPEVYAGDAGVEHSVYLFGWQAEVDGGWGSVFVMSFVYYRWKAGVVARLCLE